MTRHVSPRGRVTYYSKADPHAIYRVFDRHNRVIYIGSSYDPDARIKTHRSEQPWRAEIFRWETGWHQDWRSANAAEHAAIWREDPDHNFVGTALSAIINRNRLDVDTIAAARALRTERFAAEKAHDWLGVQVANHGFREIALRVGIPAARIQQIAEGRSAGDRGGNTTKAAKE